VSLKGKLFHATKENTQLQQEVAYLTAHLEKTVLREKMIEKDLSRIEESATKSTYRLCVGFERCEDKSEKSAPKFIPSSSYHKEEKTIKSIKAHYPSNRKPSFNPKREARKETTKSREKAFIYIFCDRAGHLDEFCYRRKRIERRGVEYARNSYCDEFIDFPPHSYSPIPPHSYSRASPHTFSHALPRTSCALPPFAHGHHHRSYGFGHERTTLCLDALDITHVLIMVIVSCVALFSLLEGLTPTLSRDTWLVHYFPVVVHVSLDQVVRCKGL
jgi:hypothetical protein